MLSDFFISTQSEFATYSECETFSDEDRCQYKYITSLEAAALLCAIREEGEPFELMGQFQLLTPEESDEWTMSTPAEFSASLIALDDSQIPTVAQRCVTSIDSLDYSKADYEQLLSDLKHLAARAASSGKTLYLWMCL